MLLLLFLLAGGLWIFRNRILNRVAKEKIAWVENVTDWRYITIT